MLATTAETFPITSAPRTRSRSCSRRAPGSRAVRIALLGLAAALGFVVILGRIGGGPLTSTGAAAGLSPVAARVWVVQPGDTLWSIALRLEPNADIRPLVDRLDAEVGGAPLYPGERIPIP